MPCSQYVLPSGDAVHLLRSLSKPRVVLIGPEQCVMSLYLRGAGGACALRGVCNQEGKPVILTSDFFGLLPHADDSVDDCVFV